MKELIILTASPAVLRFAWEHYIYLNNLREKGLSDKAQILLFIPHDKLSEGAHPMWKQLEKDFPETKFFYYPDRADYQTSILRLTQLFGYIPLLRPFCLASHFKAFPALSDKAIFYTDSDILLTEHFDFSPFLEDDVCYISEAASYTNATYFDSKYEIENGQPKFIEPSKYEALKRRDILQECAQICGITRSIVEANNFNSGAAQYLLKNIDYIFWNQVFDACIELRMHLMGINQEYMRGEGNTPQEIAKAREDNGWQSWCADIWAVTWNILRRGYTIQTPKAFDFAWATDDVERLKTAAFYHNAGITSDAKLKRKRDKVEIDCPAFFKGDTCFVSKEAISPFDEAYQPIIKNILNNPDSQTFAMYEYVKEIAKVKELYHLK